jgi:hypothetical protein|tara:strand:- start:197 stop:445 length:249 start_codon:yes stop_codon:yes gene_type:complete
VIVVNIVRKVQPERIASIRTEWIATIMVLCMAVMAHAHVATTGQANTATFVRLAMRVSIASTQTRSIVIIMVPSWLMRDAVV